MDIKTEALGPRSVRSIFVLKVNIYSNFPGMWDGLLLHVWTPQVFREYTIPHHGIYEICFL